MYKYFREGLAFLLANQQLAFTFLLFLIIPGIFIFSSQLFLSVAQENQERIERDRIAMVQDTIAEMAPILLTNEKKLQTAIVKLAEQNENISRLRIVERRGTEFIILASKNSELNGTPDEENLVGFRASIFERQRSHIFTVRINGIRHWVAFRALVADPDEEVRHFLLTDISMAHIDTIAAQNIFKAYVFLALLVVIILLVLLWQARVADYATLYKRLKEVDETKDDFISIAAHELRSPLTAIRGYAEILKDSGDLLPAQTTALSRIERSAQQLAYLIEDILDVARLQSGTMKFTKKTIELSSLVDEVIETLKATADAKKLSLLSKITADSVIIADPTRLRQVLVNIVGNAIKYTKEGSISVDIQESKHTVTISVRDTGIGISAEDQTKLFSKFFRVTSADTAGIRGTGLGLWATKSLVEQMGGTLQLESMQGVGSRFYVQFPVAKKDR